MRVNKDAFCAAAKRVVKAYYPRNREDLVLMTWNGSAGNLSVMASGPKMAVKCKLEAEDDGENFECLVKGAKMIAYLSVLTGDEVELRFEKHCLYLKTETQNVMLRCIRDAAIVKSIKERLRDDFMEVAPLPAKNLCKQVLATAHAQGEFTQNYRSACVSLEYNETGSRVAAANRFGVAIRSDLESEDGLKKLVFFGPLFVIACRSVQEDAEIKIKYTTCGTSKLLLRDDHVAIILDAEDLAFYNLSAVLVQDGQSLSTVNRKKLLSSVDIAAFTETMDRPTVMDLKDREIRIWTVSPYGEYIGNTKAETKGVQGTIGPRVFITSKSLQAALTSLTQEEVNIQYNGKAKPLFIYGDKDLEIIMSRNPDYA